MEPIDKAVQNALARVRSSMQLSDSERESRELEHLSKIESRTEATRILLGCYRLGDYSDPEVYTAAIVAVLMKYSDEIVQRVCDPSSGIPSRCKWPPTISEIVEACDAIKVRDERIEQYASGVAWVPKLEDQRGGEEESRELGEDRSGRIDRHLEHFNQVFGRSADKPDPMLWRSEHDSAYAARLQELAARDRRMLEREYTSRGEMPVMAGVLPVSRYLAKLLRGAD